VLQVVIAVIWEAILQQLLPPSLRDLLLQCDALQGVVNMFNIVGK
jgi:hypothetical protein